MVLPNDKLRRHLVRTALCGPVTRDCSLPDARPACGSQRQCVISRSSSSLGAMCGRAVFLVIAALGIVGVPQNGLSAQDVPYETFSITGRIVWLNEALERRFGIRAVPEARQQMLALETEDGQLFPIAEDIRGRAFRVDERLRRLNPCELLVRRYRGSPVVQIIRVYEISGGKKFELDYYCDICAITMFELKACDCCQGPVRLRRREVVEQQGERP